MKKILFASILSLIFFVAKAQSPLEEGIKHMENENYKAALAAFENICQTDPKSTAVYYYIGEVHYRLEDYKEAEKAYRRGISVNAQCPECKIGLGKLELDKGNVTEAEKLFKEAIAANKKSSNTFALIGTAYLRSMKPNAAKAIEYLETAKGMDPSKGWYWAQLGDAYGLSGDNGAAVSSYETAVEKDPTNSEAYISMARIWARAKQENLAIPHLQKAMELSPNDARPIKDLYELYIRERNYNKVIPLLTKYISLIGTDVDAKVRLVKFLTFQAKDYDQAIKEGVPLLAANPNEYTLHRWLAWSYAGKAKRIEEEKVGTKVVYDSIARIEWTQAYDHSKKLFDELGKDEKRKAFPEDYEIWAQSALKLGLLDEAKHIYRKYLEFEPSKAPDIYGMLAKAYFDSTNYEQAIMNWDKKTETKPMTNTEEYYYGLAHYYSKNYAAADSAFARVMRATATFANAHLMRARAADQMDSAEVKLYLAKPHYESYIDVAKVDAVKNKKGLIDAYQYMAVYYVKNDDNARGKEFINLILELDPAHEWALETLALLER